MNKRSILVLGLVLLLPLLAGCVEKEVSDTPAVVETPVVLNPYLTATATEFSLSVNQITSTLLPEPTGTPQTHVVKKGEDLGGIAYKYGVTVSAILEANPGVDPRFLSVGASLVIPAAIEKVDAENLPHPTPVAVDLKMPKCYGTSDGGAWCFLMVNNPLETAVENVLVQVQVVEGDRLITETATTPLNLIPPGGSLPVGIFFPSPLPETFRTEATILTALPRMVDDQRYLPADINDLQVDVHPDGISATVAGKVMLIDEGVDFGVVWVALAAFDSQGSIVGIRRWESQSGSSSENPLIFEAKVYSTGGKIDRVLAWVEARPK